MKIKKILFDKIESTYTKIKKNKIRFSILAILIVLGIFLRTYNLHKWLEFESDQARDIRLVESVLENKSPWPLLGPGMSRSGTSRGAPFQLGPIYYYFQITSAKIFGATPQALAYPDLLFSILSIPLLYLFLKKYFTSNLSLSLVGLYSISFFAVKYSRFALNINLIPFFVILFLLSFYEFLIKKEKTSWIWVATLGIAVGVGIQLHAILIILFLTTAFFVFVYLLKTNWKVWKKLTVVFFIIVFLNLGQIINEVRTNYSNSKLFLPRFAQDEKRPLTTRTENAVDCAIESSAYMLSSLGQDSCDFSYMKLLKISRYSKFLKEIEGPPFWLEITNFLFLVFGWGILLFRLFKEKEAARKYFLGLIAFFSALSLLVMIPVIDMQLFGFRYFIHISFLPLIFLGLVMSLLMKKCPKIYWMLALIIFGFIAIANILSIKSAYMELSANNSTGSSYVILGEIEPMIRYMIDNSSGQKEVYFSGAGRHLMPTLYYPMSYLAEKQNLNLIQTGVFENLISEKPLFYIAQKSEYDSDGKDDKIEGRKIKNRKSFGQISIYQFEN